MFAIQNGIEIEIGQMVSGIGCKWQSDDGARETASARGYSFYLARTA